MPTFVYMTRCDGCGHCVDICPSDIMHIDKTYRRAYNIEPNMCWECYSCVKACPQNAIDMRGYADFAPLGHSVRVQRDEKKGTIAWRIKFRNGTEKNFLSPITTKPWGTAIPKLATLGILVLNGAVFMHAALRDERDLAASDLSEDYRRYKSRTGMFLPRLFGR